jgi:penicillin-binding protein 1A
VLGVVWYGLDERARLVRGATGGELAAPVWGRIMRQIAPQTGDWAMPAGVETRQVDETGSIVGTGCPAYGATRTEVFLAGTAPIGECYRAPDYYEMTWSDSLGAYTYDEDYEYPVDTMPADTNEGFWSRLRERVSGHEDSLTVRRSPPMTIDSMPPAERAEPRPRQTNPRVLGRPVPTPQDTMVRDTMVRDTTNGT